jgi:predicted alpha-1,2-mannosidase
MKNIKNYFLLLLLTLIGIFSFGKITKTTTKKVVDNTKYVNTFIGTGGHGHTFPGATTPYGMVQLSPDTRTLGWDACGGYHHTDSSILGFSHTHLSGTGISDLGDFLFMPFSGEAKVIPGTSEDPDAGYRSRFSHEDEVSSPGFYSVLLKDYDIKAELTATKRAGFHKYKFRKEGKSGIIIDLSHTIYPDHKPNHQFQLISDTEISGYKGSGGWAVTQDIFFKAKFNKPFTVTFYENGKKIDALPNRMSKKLLAVLTFNTKAGEEVLAKVGISSVDYEGASKNLDSEINHWDFNKVKNEAHETWKKELSKINVKGGTEDEKTIFYTGLYHTSISPNTFSDVDFRYRGMDRKIHQSNEEKIYTVFSLWDTFRAYNPLKTITDPDKTNEFINTLLTKYDQGGILPMWELQGNYTGCMIGYHSVPVIVDAYNKGIRGYDVKKAYKAVVHASKYDTTDIFFPSKQVKNILMPKGKLYNETMDFIPADLENESVSKALEYAYNDWCIAQIAKQLKETKSEEAFMERSTYYKNVYDSKSGFMRPKLADGTFRENFDPMDTHGQGFIEGNAWNYGLYVPQDVAGMVEMMGGKAHMTLMLDSLFNTQIADKYIANHEDITRDGIIGNYVQGNEPGHHIPYLYNWTGHPEKTQARVRMIMNTMYAPTVEGLCGNDDAGQMSAWYIFSSLGFYPVTPGSSDYALGSPLVKEAKIHLSNGNTLLIKTVNQAKENIYVKRVSVNGKTLEGTVLSHHEIASGGELIFEMSKSANDVK